MDHQLACPQYLQYLRYVFAANMVVWIGLFVYIAGLAKRRRALAREVEELRLLLEHRNS